LLFQFFDHSKGYAHKQCGEFFLVGVHQMSREEVELRGMTPRHIIDVLDAVSNARRCSRMDIVNDVLGKWADERITEATLVHRVVGFNPPLTDAAGAASERLARK
jgi:hypothetical protein